MLTNESNNNLQNKRFSSPMEKKNTINNQDDEILNTNPNLQKKTKYNTIIQRFNKFIFTRKKTI